jgi:hypothetical protein
VNTDARSDDWEPRDPLEYAGAVTAALFVPLHGLTCDRNDLRVGDLHLLRLPARAWEILERGWVVDLYRDHYAARSRFFCVIPLRSIEGLEDDVDGFLDRHLGGLRALILALRLTSPGVVVDPDYTTPVIRTRDLINHRAVSARRFRLYGTVFGEDLVLPGKLRTVGERRIFYPQRVVASSGPSLQLQDSTISVVEELLALGRDQRDQPPDPVLDLAIRNFSRGHDVFLTIRERLVCLITALEAVYGGFRRGGGPSLGRLIAEAYAVLRGVSPDVEQRIEQAVRPVRNAVAHGADHHRDLDYGDSAESMRDALRVALPALLRYDGSAAADRSAVSGLRDAASAPRPVEAFQHLLVRSVDGDTTARQALARLASP